MLPQIARLYCVTIDDLYQESSLAYDNYAQRLGSVFEATRQPEDYLRAELEYRKLLKSGEYTNGDLRLYAIHQQYMMQLCMEKAGELFDRVLNQGPDGDPEVYWRVRRQKGHFLHQVSRNQEAIDEFLPKVQAGSGEIQEWVCLIQAYQFEEEYETALEWCSRAEQHFPLWQPRRTVEGGIPLRRSGGITGICPVLPEFQMITKNGPGSVTLPGLIRLIRRR